MLAALVDRIKNIAVNTEDRRDVTAAEGWLRQYERYASLESMPPRQQTDALSFLMSGIALTWYNTSLHEDIKQDWPAVRSPKDLSHLVDMAKVYYRHDGCRG